MMDVLLAEVFGLMVGIGALLWGLFLLDRKPLFGVLGMLGGMAVLLGSLAKLCDESRAE
jgi:hypothetical protein